MPNDLTITALYTSQVWAWANLPHAELFATPDAKRVFDVTNAALALARKPPLRFALLHRHAMIDHLARGARRILELAAGLSRRGATFSDDDRVHYVELDLPEVIARKRALLERTPEGRAVLARDNLELIGDDARTADLARFAPELVIAEGLAMYLDKPARRQLFERIRALGDVRLVFDLVPSGEEPAPGVAGRALEAAMKRFTGGKTFERDARARDDVLGELRAAGFADVAAHAPAEVARAWDLPHPERATTMVVFSARATRA